MAAVFGGIVVLSGAYGLHVSGLLKLDAPADQNVAKLLQAAETRIGDLEKKLADLAARPDGSGVQSAIKGLTGRLEKLEATVEDTAAPVASDLTSELAAVKSGLASLRSDVEKLPAGSSDAGVSPAELKKVQDQLTALENGARASATLPEAMSGVEASVTEMKRAVADMQSRVQNAETTAKAAQSAVSTSDVSLKTLADSQARASETLTTVSSDIKTVAETGAAGLKEVRAELDVLSNRIAEIEKTMGDATAREVAARALSVSALKSAVDSGRPFETELTAVKAGLPADTDVAALEAYAKTGVAPASVLIAEFPGVARSMYGAITAPDRSGDLLDSFIAGAKSIVAVRGPGDASGAGPEAVLRRMENAVASGNLVAGLDAYKDLPDAAKEAGADWAKRAEARVTVNKMTEAASTEVLSMLGGKDS